VPAESIHVPASTVQRVTAIVKWVAPWLLLGVTTAIGFGYHWILDRASDSDVGDKIAAERIGDIRASVLHASTLADDQQKELASVFEHLVDIEAELMVYRQYSKLAADPNRRGDLIKQAQDFYATEYAAQLEKHEPIEALRRTMRVAWAPKIKQ
jgi:hypothetical protein